MTLYTCVCIFYMYLYILYKIYCVQVCNVYTRLLNTQISVYRIFIQCILVQEISYNRLPILSEKTQVYPIIRYIRFPEMSNFRVYYNIVSWYRCIITTCMHNYRLQCTADQLWSHAGKWVFECLGHLRSAKILCTMYEIRRWRDKEQ